MMLLQLPRARMHQLMNCMEYNRCSLNLAWQKFFGRIKKRTATKNSSMAREYIILHPCCSKVWPRSSSIILDFVPENIFIPMVRI